MAIGLVTCNGCGTMNAVHRTQCLQCGTNLDSATRDVADDPTNEPRLRWLIKRGSELLLSQKTLKLAFIPLSLLSCYLGFLAWQSNGQFSSLPNKPTYEAAIPWDGTFIVQSPYELTETEAIQAALKSLNQKNSRRAPTPVVSGGRITERRAASPIRQSRAIAAKAVGCQTGHWISSKTDDGAIIVLDDGSVWQVDAVDTITASLWLPFDDIVVCGDTMINLDDKETIYVVQVR